MRGYDHRTYGDAFADVYDDWYQDVSDVDRTVAELARLAGGGRVLELGVGTGRLALPLAKLGALQGVRVEGIDASEAMLAKLRQRDPTGLVATHVGDMQRDLPAGPFRLVFAAFNTFFNLTSLASQQECLAAVATCLEPGGRLVIEAFVPEPPHRQGSRVEVRALSVDRVVLAISVSDAVAQTAEGQFVELSESGGVRLRPWAICYAEPGQLDAMAATAGLEREARWENFARERFTARSPRHVSIYRRPPLDTEP